MEGHCELIGVNHDGGVIIIIIIMGLFQSHSENTRATYQENMKSRNYRKQPYWALHTYFGK